MPFEFYALIAAIFLPLLVVPAVLCFGQRLKSRTGWLTLVAPVISAALLLWVGSRAGVHPNLVVSVPWVPSMDVHLSFLIDGISLFFGLVICGVGSLVCWYSAEYLGDEYKSHNRFYTYLLIFMTAMLGTVFAENILLLFIFWEITGVASFLLIGFSHEEEKSRTGARQALLVTAATGLCMLTGIIMLGASAGTYSLSQIDPANVMEGSPIWLNVMCILLLLGAFGKSAQFPFHFWLPGAMAAPTPVSAYLHSATMVKLGVFLTARLFPIFNSLELWFWLVCSIGFFTMLIGAFLALRSNDLKSILAYSTVSQLGFLIGAYGVGSRAGVMYDQVHVLSHVFYKGALFMVAGIVDHSTGTRDIRKLGGLAKTMPITTFCAAVGLAALAGLPLTTGFISKELLLADLEKVGGASGTWVTLFTVFVVLAATMSVAFALRMFVSVFCGRLPSQLHVHKPNLSIQIPPAILAAGALVFGVLPSLLDKPLDALKVTGLHKDEHAHLALWHGFSFPLFVSLGVFVLGTLLYLWGERSGWRKASIPRLLRFDAGFERGLNGLTYTAKALTKGLKADWPPLYIPIVLSFLIAIFIAAALTSPESFIEGLVAIEWKLSPIRTFVAMLISIALLGVVILPRWTAQLVALSGAGFLLTFYFMLYRAPDLAMTQILVESASVVMILLLLSRFPSSQLVVRTDPKAIANRVFRIMLSVGMGLIMFMLVIFAQTHRHPNPVGERILQISKTHADGYNAVNTILVDFRGFDTMGEITVLFIATLGALGLMMRYKRRYVGTEPTVPGLMLEEERDRR